MKRTRTLTRAGTLEEFYSADPPMQRCLKMAHVAARTELPVLILGESGTGKTLLARAVHRSSARADGAFISFNAAALSDTLLDSQLFGHEKGAFTGADRAVKGKFELADRGTLFFDEIADLSPSGQAKILRAVEYGEFERLGSEELRVADVRLVSATHLPLEELVESKHFRKDLFHRIKGIAISVPPLRARPADLRALLVSEIARAARQLNKEIHGLEEDALKLLLDYHWPGNLRELNQVMHVAVALAEDGVIGKEAVLLEHGLERQAPRPGGVNVPQDSPRGEDETLRTLELQQIRRILAANHGNKRKTARVLGISRSTLDRKMHAYGLGEG